MNNTVSCGALMEALTYMLENRTNDASIMALRQAQNSVNTDKRPADKLMNMSADLGMDKNVKDNERELAQSFNTGMMDGAGEPQGPLPTEDEFLQTEPVEEELPSDEEVSEVSDEEEVSDEQAEANVGMVTDFVQQCMDSEAEGN